MKSKRLATSLARVMCLGFAIVIAASVGRELIEHSEISKQRDFANLLDSSGAVESLSQRLSFLTLGLITTSNPSLKANFIEKLENTIESFDRQTEEILAAARSSDSILSNTAKDIVFAQPFSLERDLKRFITAIKKTIVELEAENENSRYLLRSATHSSDVYRGLSALRHQIATDAKVSVANAKRLSYALLAINICFILGLAVFILRYLIRRLESEERCREAAELKLKEQVEELQSFSGVIAHDLKGPLHNIHISGKMALQRLSIAEQADTETVALLELVVSQSEKLSKMIQTLLEFFRQSSKPIHKRRIALSDVMDELSDRFSSEIHENQLRLKCDKSRTIYVDETLIVQVFQNLVENALKYSGAKPVEITATAKNISGGQEVIMSDNGKGVPTGKLEKIFEPFYQNGCAAERNGGIGLGLPFVRKAVMSHGGRASASNGVGGGLKVRMTFPAP